MRYNPWTGTGVWYPASENVLLAYHGVQGKAIVGGDPPYMSQSHGAETSFRNIWMYGEILSFREREDRGIKTQRSLFGDLDKIAGDDRYVFLRPSFPHAAGEYGFNFIFDVNYLVKNGALISLEDLGGSYMQIARNMAYDFSIHPEKMSLREKKQFLQTAHIIQQIWRLKGKKALQWTDWVMGKTERYPVDIYQLKYAMELAKESYYDNIIRWISTSQESATKSAEILVRDSLPVEWACGVIFRKNYFKIDDFVSFYGMPGEAPPKDLSPMQPYEHRAYVEDRTGVPGKCPVCGEWLRRHPLEKVKTSWFSRTLTNVKHPKTGKKTRAYVCQSCGATFAPHSQLAKQFFRSDEYLGNIAELEKIY